MRRRSSLFFVTLGTALLAGLAFDVAPASAADSPSASGSAASAAAIMTLPNCAVTFTPQTGSAHGLTCLQARSTRVTSGSGARGAAAVHPDLSNGLCVFQNGPISRLSTNPAALGWRLCFAGAGNIQVPRTFDGFKTNDEASSWRSFCSGGTFFANQPGTRPSNTFPANHRGNFPWGGVLNDSLSSFRLNVACG